MNQDHPRMVHHFNLLETINVTNLTKNNDPLTNREGDGDFDLNHDKVTGTTHA